MNFFQTYSDWIYIGSVLIAFLFFIFWNKNRNASIKNRKRQSFKQALKDKRKKQ
jgi:hypothetical protein